MAIQSLSFKSYRKLMLAAAIGASAFATILSPSAASAFGFHGGFGGGFHGGGFGGFHGGGFGGGFGHQMPNHFAGLRDPGFGHHPFQHPFPRPFPHPFPHCHHFGCGPIYGGPVYGGGGYEVETASVGPAPAAPAYYRQAVAPAPAPDCNAQTGTFVIIGFVPTAAAADVAKFLQAYQVAITDGPNQDSDFIIKLSDRKMTDKEVQAEIAEMQAEKSIVRFVSQQDASSARN